MTTLRQGKTQAKADTQRQSPASLLLLVLPALLLVGLALILQPRKEALTLDSAEAVHIVSKGTTAGDTQDLTVRVVVRSTRLRFGSNGLESPCWTSTCCACD